MYEEEKKQIVLDRIWLVKRMINLNSEFIDHNLTRSVINNMGVSIGFNPYTHYSSLLNYLMLTCFDILGQQDDWKDFNTWLVARSKKEERESVFRKFENVEFGEKIKKVHDEYLLRYGVKRSFHNFIEDLLSPKSKQRLINSIKVSKVIRESQKLPEGGTLSGASTPIEVTEKEKLNFLFKIRNSFTHQGISIGSPVGMFKDFFSDKFFTNAGVCEVEGTGIFREKRKEEKIIYSVYGWPSLLIEIIEDYVENNLEK